MNEKKWFYISKKILLILLFIMISILLNVFLIFTLVPLVSWWFGVLNLFLGGLFYFLLYKKKQNNQESSLLYYWLKITIVAIFFGLFMHTSCRIYSNYRASELKKDCQQEKDHVFKSISIEKENLK